jgi:hypothetical protein
MVSFSDPLSAWKALTNSYFSDKATELAVDSIPPKTAQEHALPVSITKPPSRLLNLVLENNRDSPEQLCVSVIWPLSWLLNRYSSSTSDLSEGVGLSNEAIEQAIDSLQSQRSFLHKKPLPRPGANAHRRGIAK